VKETKLKEKLSEQSRQDDAEDEPHGNGNNESPDGPLGILQPPLKILFKKSPFDLQLYFIKYERLYMKMDNNHILLRTFTVTDQLGL
jgi:hypothetical protein